MLNIAPAALVQWLSGIVLLCPIGQFAGMDDLEQLMEQMRACAICADLPLGPRPLFKLDARARVLIAGQAPGRITHQKGIPFDDPSGNRLRDWLGVTRDVFYNDPRIAILPMGLCFPGNGKSGDLPPRVECAPAWRDQALAMMPDLELILIIGRYAIDWHVPDAKGQSITALASNWQATWPDQLVMPHPSPRNNRWLKTNPWFEVDVIPALRKRVAGILS
jgi:uracil-DNA glycosylase